MIFTYVLLVILTILCCLCLSAMIYIANLIKDTNALLFACLQAYDGEFDELDLVVPSTAEKLEN